jgi:type I restriction enzyme S subunit
MEKQLIPTLRFSEFSEKWQNVLFSDIAIFSKGKNISKSDIIEDGETECIRYGELYTDYGEVIENIVSRTNLPKESLVFSEFNDVIIPSSGETQLDIATASCVKKSGIALGGDLNIIKTKNNGVFLSFYLNYKKKKDIASLAQGNSVVHLYNSQLKGLKLNIPQLLEQQKIATFLISIDTKITQLTKKKTLLEQYKKGIMQKIFSQGLRFKDDNGNNYPDWEKKKLKDFILDFIVPMRDKPKNLDGDIPWCRIEDFDGKYLTKSKSNQGVTEETVKKMNLKVYPVNTLLVSCSANLGFCAIVKKELITNQTFIGLFPDLKKINVDFLYHVMKLSSRELNILSSGTTISYLSRKQFEKFKINYPCTEEQTKIANFLSAIDAKINHVNNQLEQTNIFKKGLLQQMFV